MHIPDGFLDPKFSAGMMAASAFAIFHAISNVKQAVTEPSARRVLAGISSTTQTMTERSKQILGNFGRNYILKIISVSILIFSIQMFDFKIFSEIPIHLLGGTFAAILLGPFGGMSSMAGALTAQALFLGDGGVFALGANIINIALVGSFAAYYIYDFFRHRMPLSLAVAAAAFLSVMLSAASFSLMAGFNLEFLRLHAIVGTAEAFVTLGAVKILRKVDSRQLF